MEMIRKLEEENIFHEIFEQQIGIEENLKIMYESAKQLAYRLKEAE